MSRGRPPVNPKTETCTAPGCERASRVRNLCWGHYAKTRRPPRCPVGKRHVWTLMGRCKACGAERET